MSETISGDRDTLQILNPGSPTVIITGTVEAGSSLGTGALSIASGFGAVYGPAPADFTLTNRGLVIDTHGKSTIEANDGIILGAIGTVNNAGSILSPFGSGVFLYTGGAVVNSGSIIAYVEGIDIGASTLSNVQDFIRNTGVVEVTEKPFQGQASYETYLSFGIVTDGAGTIDNAATGTIDALYGVGILLAAELPTTSPGVETFAAGSILNAGTVEAKNAGVIFYAAGTFTNTGDVGASETGVVIDSGVLSNSGKIDGGMINAAPGGASSIFYDGINLLAGGSISNSNSGVITSGSGFGVYLKSNGTLNNAGLISGYTVGVSENQDGAVINSGVITATKNITINGTVYGNVGVGVGYDGGLINAATGTIIADLAVVGLDNATVDNSGTIIGSSVSVFFKEFGDRLIEHPGSVLEGFANDDTGAGILELGTGNGTGETGFSLGEVNGVTSGFVGFNSLVVDAGAKWEIVGSNDISDKILV